jgi:hypothetical protein
LLAARIPGPPKPTNPLGPTALAFASEQAAPSRADSSNRPVKPAVKQQPASSPSNSTILTVVKQQAEPSRALGPTKLAAVKLQAPAHRPGQNTLVLLDSLTSTIDSGNLFVPRELTAADMIDYVNRNYGTSRTAEALSTDLEYR